MCRRANPGSRVHLLIVEHKITPHHFFEKLDKAIAGHVLDGLKHLGMRLAADEALFPFRRIGEASQRS